MTFASCCCITLLRSRCCDGTSRCCDGTSRCCEVASVDRLQIRRWSRPLNRRAQLVTVTQEQVRYQHEHSVPSTSFRTTIATTNNHQQQLQLFWSGDLRLLVCLLVRLLRIGRDCSSSGTSSSKQLWSKPSESWTCNRRGSPPPSPCPVTEAAVAAEAVVGSAGTLVFQAATRHRPRLAVVRLFASESRCV
jgi:hypothetical protein